MKVSNSCGEKVWKDFGCIVEEITQSLVPVFALMGCLLIFRYTA